MADDPQEAEREAFLDQFTADLLEDHRDIILAEFIEDRLAYYFEKHPELSDRAQSALAQARDISELSASAALVFAMSSVEITIRDVLLKPIIAGLVHNPDMSDIMTDLIDLRDNKTITILTFMMQEIGLPRLIDQRLPSGEMVWQEKNRLQKMRNNVLHRGETVSAEQAERAIELAEHFLQKLYPAIRDHLTHRSTGWV